MRKIGIFSELTGDEIGKLSEYVREQRIDKGVELFHQEEPGDAMYFILKGGVRIYLYSLSGRELTLAVLKSGQFFGEMSLLDGMPRSANAVTMENTDFIVLKRNDFLNVLHAYPIIAIKILKDMSIRVREADAMIEDFALLNVYDRLIKYMDKLIKTDGRKEEYYTVITHNIKRQDIASAIGTTRETVSRVLSSWQRKGYIRLLPKKMIVYRDMTLRRVQH
ncbi:MAG: Crp/Fnr family transcriptional regulator [Deltaproteobacteria bacterium]|nr:Crp/Fnr family transcriptional regulator [Deltaproteobacteria bacterium]MCL5276329.1 Crp/Fnr family transcriptional regulator [Deltaproteobacteria bacterium]